MIDLNSNEHILLELKPYIKYNFTYIKFMSVIIGIFLIFIDLSIVKAQYSSEYLDIIGFFILVILNIFIASIVFLNLIYYPRIRKEIDKNTAFYITNERICINNQYVSSYIEISKIKNIKIIKTSNLYDIAFNAGYISRITYKFYFKDMLGTLYLMDSKFSFNKFNFSLYDLENSTDALTIIENIR